MGGLFWCLLGERWVRFAVWAMLVPDCILLFTAVFAFFCCAMILVEKKVTYTWIHNHTAALSTWTHAHHVNKNDYLTLKQKQKNVANTKQDADSKQSCGFP